MLLEPEAQDTHEPMNSQQYNCLNKTNLITPADKPMWMRKISEDSTGDEEEEMKSYKWTMFAKPGRIHYVQR